MLGRPSKPYPDSSASDVSGFHSAWGTRPMQFTPYKHFKKHLPGCTRLSTCVFYVRTMLSMVYLENYGRVTYAGQSASQLFCPKFAAVSTLRLKGRLRHPRSTQVQSTRSSGLYSIPSDKLCTRSSGLYIISENETHYPSGRETYSSTTVDRIAVLPLLS